MGYTQDCQVNLEVPRASVPRVEAFITEWQLRFAPHVSLLPPDNIMGEGVARVIGDAGDVDTFWRTEIDGKSIPPLCLILGSTWGKSSTEEERFLTRLAELAVTGTIEARGEDGTLWCWRLKGGDLGIYRGIVAYPEDPDQAPLSAYVG